MSAAEDRVRERAYMAEVHAATRRAFREAGDRLEAQRLERIRVRDGLPPPDPSTGNPVRLPLADHPEADIWATDRKSVTAPLPVEGCTHWADGAGECGVPAAGRWLPGWRCLAHTPAALRGGSEPVPRVDWTLDGRRRAWALERGLEPRDELFRAPGETIVDWRVKASGKRRSSPTEYRAAQAATTTRRSS